MAMDIAMLEALNADERFLLHLDVTAVLKKRLAEKVILEEQLQRLHTAVPTRARDLVGLPTGVTAKFRLMLDDADALVGGHARSYPNPVDSNAQSADDPDRYLDDSDGNPQDGCTGA